MAKTIVELRAMAHALGCKFTFADNEAMLRRKIDEAVQKKAPPAATYDPVTAPDWRLTTRPPARWCDQDMIKEALSGHIERGMRLSFPTPETWRMAFDKREDTGSIRMPLRVVVKCADQILK